jgi:ribosomal protein S18 acetylase RimI-like enzyme
MISRGTRIVFATVVDGVARLPLRLRATTKQPRRRQNAPGTIGVLAWTEIRARGVGFSPVDGLQIRAMTQEEFSSYRRRVIGQYAAELARTGASTAEQAEQRAANESDQFLPDGLDTAGMALLVGEIDGEVVGLVWVGPAPAGRAGWWIYDIEVVPDRRGQGYGRALLEAAERDAQQRGAVSIGLDVFGGNDVALGMYESSGYEVAATRMLKRFASSSGPD